jgi:phosphonate transport system ATP-binding protein
MIRFEDVSVTYRGGVQALRGLDLTIEDGEFIVIVGLSGAGKSTLLRALNGLVPATGGSITVDDVEVVGASAAELRALRSQIGMIFQTFNLVNRTSVLNNVLMGRLGTVPVWRSTLGLWPADDRERAMQALERVGIVEKAYVRASNLSGGQQQRVGIARALVQEPSVMLADEPVASLDPVTSRQVMGDLQRINRDLGITTIVNLHYLDLAQEFGSRLVGLRDGELVFDGDITDVDDDTFMEIYGRAISDDDLVGTEGRPDVSEGGTARPVRPRPRLRTFGITAGLLAFTGFAAREVEFAVSTFWEVWNNPLWEKFWPVPWDWVLDRSNVLDPLVETFQIAILATIVGCGLALPISFAMSRLTAPNRPTYLVSRSVMNVVRAVPDLFWAKLLVTAVGIGAFAGTWALSVFSLAVMVKLFSETVDIRRPAPARGRPSHGLPHLRGDPPACAPPPTVFRVWRRPATCELRHTGGIDRLGRRRREGIGPVARGPKRGRFLTKTGSTG